MTQPVTAGEPAAERDLTTASTVSPSEPVVLLRVTCDSLGQLAARLAALGADDSDLILALPAGAAGAAAVLAEPDELINVAQSNIGICVAASAASLASAEWAERIEAAVVEEVGSPMARCHPFPYAMLGPAAELRSLLADLPPGASDADRLTAAVLSNRHDVAVDMESVLFHVLDGTGTDIVIVAGRAQVAGEQPLVLIDPSSGRRALVRAEAELVDGGARDLGRILRYDGAVASGDEVFAAAPDVVVVPLWTPSFCATVIRAAEAAGAWTNTAGGNSTSRLEVALNDLSPRLFSLLEDDLNSRVWPLLWERSTRGFVTLSGATIIRWQAGGWPGSSTGSPTRADLVGSVRLNDGYSGANLHLPDQQWDDGRAAIGGLTIWPAGPSHPSETEPVIMGVKYTLGVWLRTTTA